MKKKGLIVATIVMVLVLAVSLTTATYAWFTNEGSAKVDPISFAVSSAADVLIGVSQTNTYVGTPTASAFWSDSTNWTGSAWTGDTNGLGLSVNTGTDLSGMTKAVYSFNNVSSSTHLVEYFKEVEEGTTGAVAGSSLSAYTWTTGSEVYSSAKFYLKQANSTGATLVGYDTAKDYLGGTMDAYNTGTAQAPSTANIATDIKATGKSGLIPSTTLYKASGNGNNITQGTLAVAQNFSDYLNIAFGAAPATSDVMGMGCMVYVSPQDAKASLGLNAAIHVLYNVNNEGWHEYDVYGTNGYSTVKSGMTAPNAPQLTIDEKSVDYTGSTALNAQTKKAGDAYVWIPLAEVDDEDNTLTQDAIEQVQIIVYICGPDADCLTAATGVSATISIEFLSVNKGAWNA